jgi:hypothetical protein
MVGTKHGTSVWISDYIAFPGLVVSLPLQSGNNFVFKIIKVMHDHCENIKNTEKIKRKVET